MSYDPHVYVTGETITDADLNHSEQGIADAHAQLAALDATTASNIANATSATNAALAPFLNRANQTGTQPANTISGLASVATSGAYGDLSGRPALATVATSGAYTDLTGKPALAAVATSGSYNDLTSKPTITPYTDAQAIAAVGPAVVSGNNTTVTYDAGAGTITIDASNLSTVSLASLPPNTMLGVFKPNGGSWPTRPSTRSDLVYWWIGQDPDPTIGGSYAISGVDQRIVLP